MNNFRTWRIGMCECRVNAEPWCCNATQLTHCYANFAPVWFFGTDKQRPGFIHQVYFSVN